ncbi:ubiquitin domain protein [Penicillium taxi]|uniref:ubiquitin domain protein n=1 Tax=Penicillium taxi TaxID=168475 RepID=UPI002545BDBD|nr:ubiquitin domain protein [Penicillium taxi]KAJ5902161.1 ubiquitin domain protein [Penicillium taxi]
MGADEQTENPQHTSNPTTYHSRNIIDPPTPSPSYDPVTLQQHFNLPIRPHNTWFSRRHVWTRAKIDQERRDFFFTRVTGRPEVWAAIDTALTLMRAGDIATAQSIIDAAGITVPTGDFSAGCYDEQGVLYRLPRCIVSDPKNLAEDAPEDTLIAANDLQDHDAIREQRRAERGKGSERDLITVKARLVDGKDVVVVVDGRMSVGFVAQKIHKEAGLKKDKIIKIVYLGRVLHEHESLLDQGWRADHIVNAMAVFTPLYDAVSDIENSTPNAKLLAAARYRDAIYERSRTGKNKTTDHDSISVKVRLSSGDLVLKVDVETSVGELAKQIHVEAELDNDKRVRLALKGHMLKEGQSLPEQGWKNGQVLNGMIVFAPLSLSLVDV